MRVEARGEAEEGLGVRRVLFERHGELEVDGEEELELHGVEIVEGYPRHLGPARSTSDAGRV